MNRDTLSVAVQPIAADNRLRGSETIYFVRMLVTRDHLL